MPERMRPVALGTGDPSRWKSWGARRLSDARRAVKTHVLQVMLEARAKARASRRSASGLERAEHDQRQVVPGALRAGPVEHRGDDVLGQLARVVRGIRAHHLLDALGAELLSVLVLRLGDAVRVHDDDVAIAERHGALFVLRVLEHAQRHAALGELLPRA